MAITTTSLLPAPVQQWFSAKLLSVPTPNMIHNTCAMRQRMPRNSGTTIRFRRYNPLATAMVPLNVKLAEVKSSLIDLETEVTFS
jgi:N4-gp56 family major capsid protein